MKNNFNFPPKPNVIARAFVITILVTLLASERSERDTLRSVQSRIAIYVYTRKMVPITGRASASFSSMLKL